MNQKLHEIPTNMDTLNRIAIVLRPRQPFIDWINGTDPDGRPLTLAEVDEDCSLYLVSEDPDDDVERALADVWREIFEQELFGWYTDESRWPKELTYTMFQEWFEVEVHSMVRELGFDPLIIEDL